MLEYMQIHCAHGATFEIPLDHQRSEDPDPHAPFDDDDDFTPPVVSVDIYSADQPYCPGELNITEVLFFSETLEEPFPVVLESFTLVEEGGPWTLTIYRRDYGPPDFDLRYETTVKYGEPLREPLGYQWDHDQRAMISD
jgi:hypothetical protein